MSGIPMPWVVFHEPAPTFNSMQHYIDSILRDIVPEEHIDGEVRRLRIAEGSLETSHSRICLYFKNGAIKKLPIKTWLSDTYLSLIMDCICHQKINKLLINLYK